MPRLIVRSNFVGAKGGRISEYSAKTVRQLRSLVGSRIVGSLIMSSVIVLCSAVTASAQKFEVSGGWTHITQDFGTDGFDIGGAIKFVPKIGVALAFNYDVTWDTSHIETFNTSVLGATSVKSHLQD